MPTNTSKPFPTTILPVFMPLFRLSKNYTRHGTAAVCARSMLHFLMGCGQVLRKLRSTITRPQRHTHIHLLCVSFFLFIANVSLPLVHLSIESEQEDVLLRKELGSRTSSGGLEVGRKYCELQVKFCCLFCSPDDADIV